MVLRLQQYITSRAVFGLVVRTVILPDEIKQTTRIHFMYLYAKKLMRRELFRGKGYSVEKMREFKWKCSCIVKYGKIYDKRFNALQQLDPRDAFFGSWTKPTKLKYIVKSGKKFKYIGVCCFYFTVQYYDYFTAAHQIIINQPPKYNKNCFGITKCNAYLHECSIVLFYLLNSK